MPGEAIGEGVSSVAVKAPELTSWRAAEACRYAVVRVPGESLVEATDEDAAQLQRPQCFGRGQDHGDCRGQQ